MHLLGDPQGLKYITQSNRHRAAFRESTILTLSIQSILWLLTRTDLLSWEEQRKGVGWGGISTAVPPACLLHLRGLGQGAEIAGDSAWESL